MVKAWNVLIVLGAIEFAAGQSRKVPSRVLPSLNVEQVVVGEMVVKAARLCCDNAGAAVFIR